MAEANSNSDEEDIPTNFLENEEEDPDCPIVILTKEEYLAMCKPWRNALIIKVLRSKVGYSVIRSRIVQMWKPTGQMIMTDVGNGFFVIRTSNKEDYEKALFEGPWMISEHYLTVQLWYPAFDPEIDSIKWLVVWVQVPKLPLQFFNKNSLARVGDKLGKTLRVDETTLIASRGKYVWISVEIDFEKPLVAKFRFCKRVRRVEYEGLHAVCFHCGRYGHKIGDYP